MGLMHSRWPIFAALLAGITAVAAIGYILLANNSEGEAVPASGGRYLEGVARPPERMNPLYAYANPTDRDLAALIFSGLVRLGPDGTPQPDLAERWEITGNGSSYVFYLRHGIAWQDDPEQPFTSDDVVFTFDAITAPGFRGDPELAQLMDGVTVVARDTYTVEFRLEQPYAPFLAYLTVGILPSHLLQRLDADGLYNAQFNLNPVGTGPYRFRSRTSSGVVLDANDTYHFGPPHISTIELREYTDESALSQALRRGEVDGALLSPSAPESSLTSLRDTGRFAVHELSETALLAVEFDTRSPLFADTTVRGALMRGIDRKALIDGVTGGSAIPAAAGIPPGSWAFTGSDVPSFDPGEAARALEIAGWSRGSDGVRTNAGLRLAFALSAPNDATSIALAEQVSRQWRAIGAEVTVLPRDAGTYVESALLPRDFEAAIAQIDYGPDPDPYPFWHSTQAQPPGRNIAAYDDPALDDALERARQTTNVDRRKELYAEFARLFLAGAPAVPLYHPSWIYFQSTAVKGFEGSTLFTTAARFYNVHEWYLRTRRVD